MRYDLRWGEDVVTFETFADALYAFNIMKVSKTPFSLWSVGEPRMLMNNWKDSPNSIDKEMAQDDMEQS